MNADSSSETPVSRRQFVKSSTVAAAGSLAATHFALARAARLGGTETLTVGLIGCGGRGTGAAQNAMQASENVRITAIGDVFEERVRACQRNLASMGDRAHVADRDIYVGFDAFKGVLESNVDVVILATPPHFRPEHFDHAIRADKHVFMEKPVAVDPTGVRRVIAAAGRAGEAGLNVVAGTQRRHERSYLAAMEQLADGAIGDVVAARCYWNQGGLWMHEPRPEWSDMEWQLRNWLYFTWLSGDHIVEQHIHNLDVCNWAMGATPIRALALGGREVRTHPNYGHIYDHFAVEYEYPDGRFMLSMCRQIDGCDNRVHEVVHGTKGRMMLSPGRATIEGDAPWRFRADNPNPYMLEHTDLQESIRTGKPLNEGRRVAESTLTAIMGRMSAYTGKEVTWDQAMNSELDLTPSSYEFGPMPVPPVAVPGRTPLI